MPIVPRAIPLAVLLFVGCGRSVVTAPSPGRPAGAGSSSAARLATADALVPALPAAVGMDPALTARIDSIVAVAINEGVAPGVSVAVGRFGRLVHLKGYGAIDYAVGAPSVDPTTMYDLASLTKVVATTTAAMILEDEGKLDVNRTVHSYVPELDAPEKAGITVRMILTHRGGFEAFAPLHLQYRGRAEYLAQINARPLTSVPGTKMVYSDWDFILMQAVVERITGTTLDAFVASRVFGPLGISARFTPDTSDAVLLRHIAVTAMDSVRGLIHGVVHDPNAWAMGGVAGHAGLFASARDLAVFAQMLLNGGSYGGARIVRPTTLARWTAVQDPNSSRALGWDTPSAVSSAGHDFSTRSFGHTGFTGTSMWMDPERSVFVVVLANRVNSRGESTRHAQLRRDVADAVQSAIRDAPLIDWEARR